MSQVVKLQRTNQMGSFPYQCTFTSQHLQQVLAAGWCPLTNDDVNWKVQGTLKGENTVLIIKMHCVKFSKNSFSKKQLAYPNTSQKEKTNKIGDEKRKRQRHFYW